MRSLLRPWPLRRLALSIALCAGACLLARQALGERLWWLGLPLALAAELLWKRDLEPTRLALRDLSEQRLLFNLKLSGLKVRPQVWPFQMKLAIWGAVLAALGAWAVQGELALSLAPIKEWLLPERVWARVEFPAYSEREPEEIRLDANEALLTVDSGSYLQLLIKHPKGKEDWLGTLSISTPRVGEAPAEDTRTQLPLTLARARPWGSSMQNLLTQLNADPRQAQTLLLELERDGEHVKLKLDVSPIPIPIVKLEPRGQAATEAALESAGRLLFSVQVDSKVPLSLVEFQVRTKSGYRFTKTLAEFANSNQLEFQASEAQLAILGIPFTAKDSLFVKVVARTVVPTLWGESRELEFAIKSRQEIRAELMERLQKILGEFEKGEAQGPFAARQEEIDRELGQAIQDSNQLGRQSPVRRSLGQARESAQRMESFKDADAARAESKVRAALEQLKRQQRSEQTQGLIARMQSLRNAISRARDAQERNKLGEDAEKLAGEAEAAKKELGEMLEKGRELTLEEKQLGQQLLEFDKSEIHLRGSAEKLAADRSAEAAAKANQALEEAQRNLGGAMQLLQQARRRAMEQARQKLTEADKELQEARDEERLQQAAEKAGKAGKALKQMPELSEEFGEAVAEAQRETGKAERSAKAGKPQGFDENAENAQEAIVKALAALQEEEESEKESQKEQEGRNFRTAMDALTAQGQLDVGWRKKILEEIARLRGQGEAPDSPIIRYLEGRLR